MLLLFAEFFQDVPLPELAARAGAMGLDGLDLSVRPNGNLRPEAAETELPRAAEILAAQGLRIGKITTAIQRADDPLTRRVLQTARALGVTHYQVNNWLYREFGSLRALRTEVRACLRDLAALNADLGITGLIQNHSCEQFGANLCDLDYVLEGIDPAHLGLYYDHAHATIEGGGLGWLMSLDLISDHIAALGVKDFRWVDGNHRHCGGQRNQSAEFCPLGAGNTPWREILPLLPHLAEIPVIFFGEYRDENCFALLSAEAALEQVSRDVKLFRNWSLKTN